jgi:hypothetical protein
MANPKKYLKLINGNVELHNINGQRLRLFYSKGDATRCDWEDEAKECVQVQIKSGKILLINNSCQVYRTI